MDTDPVAAPVSSAPSFPAMSHEAIRKVRALQDALASCEQVELPIEHLLHAGMYARTVRLAPGVALVGSLLKVATVVIVSGDCTVFIGQETIALRGYNVLAGSAGRKQAFLTHGEVCITALFPTEAPSVREAEAEATDEHESLLSRRQGLEKTAITGETPCRISP